MIYIGPYLREKSECEAELMRKELTLRRDELWLANDRLAMEKAEQADMLKLLAARK